MCYDDLWSLYAATAKERDELRRELNELKKICEKQTRLNRTVAVLTLELDKVTAERDALLEGK